MSWNRDRETDLTIPKEGGEKKEKGGGEMFWSVKKGLLTMVW